MTERKIAYEKHPVSPARKAELRAKGFKILDIRFKLAEAIAAPADPEEGSGDLAELRTEYERVLGKKPFMGWGADELRKRMAEAGE